MPELPEVETVRRTLKKQILGKPIQNIEIIYPKIIENTVFEFKNRLIGSPIKDILRKGKYLIFETDKCFLISHLRMEGKYFIKTSKDKIIKHEHIIFQFKDFDLRYHDTRKFGRMKVINKEDLDKCFINLGPDANETVNIDGIYQRIHNSSLPIKSLLLDQSIIAGLGNIYVDEVLYESQISPLRKGCLISFEELTRIVNNSKKILNQAIKYKGTTIRSYTSSLGVYGQYQQFLKVHTKDGFKCCNNHDIIKIRVGGRGTYYCPKCQK